MPSEETQPPGQLTGPIRGQGLAASAADGDLHAFFDQAAVGIAIAGADGRIQKANPRFFELTGYAPDDIGQLTFSHIADSAEPKQTGEHIERTLAAGATPCAFEKRAARKDQTAAWVRVTITPFKDATGNPKGFTGVVEDITARKLAGEALAARERELSLVYTNVSDVIFMLDVEPDGRFRFKSVNQAFLSTTGLTREQVVGKLVRDVIPEPSLTLVLGHYQTAIREKRTVTWEETTKYPAGEKVGLVSVTPVFEKDGRCLNLIGTVHEITEHKREEELRARLAAVVESSDDAIISKSLQGIIRTWNAGAQRLFGYTAEEVVGKSITILIPPDRIQEEDVILSRLRRGERIEHFETIRVTKDGRPLDISLSISPVRDSTGRLIGASKIARDITARRKMEQALREESLTLELLNQTGTIIASQLDLQALVQSVTDAGTRLSGAEFGAFFYNVTNEQGESYTLYTLSGAPREAFENFGVPRNTPVFGPTFRGEGVVRSDDITRDSRYGKMAPHFGMPEGHLPVRSYLATPVIARSGEVIGGLFFGHSRPGVFTDRTERLITGIAAQAAVAIDNARLYDSVKKAGIEREKLLEAERAARGEAERVSLLKDEFLATLSHELRTPLNAILGWSQLLHARARQDPELTEGLAVIERNTKVQAQLIEDLLDMSRIISGKIRLDVQPVDVQDVVKAAVASVQHAADAKEIRLQLVLDPLAGPVRGDPGRLQQCFWNLLTNAIKFTPKGGRVQVTLERVNSHLEVCVVDNGEGIKPEFLPHLFERFRQADASTTRRHGGLGLGLSIVKQLVELHGGQVRAKSGGEGKGATFCVELPLMVIHGVREEDARRHPRSPAGAAQAPDYPSLAGVKVLAVDDEPDALNLIQRVLEGCGANVLVAASAEEALEMIKGHRPDMIVSDIGMPGQDGYEFIHRVRALPPEQGGQTPAAALTAFARAEDRTRALRAGYQIHVSKPVEPMELAAVVASLALRH